MSPDTPWTWQEAARGIPVWDGARALFDRATGWQGGRVLDAEEMRVLDRGSVVRWSGGAIVPDLPDSDTQAAYLRRLAIALGCPEGAAEEGVAFNVVPDPLGHPMWVVVAGYRRAVASAQWATWGPCWVCEVVDGNVDRLMALAEAWPSDKRVRP